MRQSILNWRILGVVSLITIYSISVHAQTSFINRTTADGLGNNSINGVYVSGDNVYVATPSGLSISNDGGVSFTNYTTADGLASDFTRGVYVSGGTIYVGTTLGLSIAEVVSSAPIPTMDRRGLFILSILIISIGVTILQRRNMI